MLVSGRVEFTPLKSLEFSLASFVSGTNYSRSSESMQLLCSSWCWICLFICHGFSRKVCIKTYTYRMWWYGKWIYMIQLIYFSKIEGIQAFNLLKSFTDTVLGGGFNYFWNFHPENWGRWTHFDEHIFQMGWFNHPVGGSFGGDFAIRVQWWSYIPLLESRNFLLKKRREGPSSFTI